MSDPFSPTPDSSDKLCLPETKEPAGPPRLGISHLLLWMTCSAVLLAVDNFLQTAYFAQLRGINDSRKIVLALSAIMNGPAVAALGIWVVRTSRGIRFPVQPGEWLLVLMGISTIFS